MTKITERSVTILTCLYMTNRHLQLTKNCIDALVHAWQSLGFLMCCDNNCSSSYQKVISWVVYYKPGGLDLSRRGLDRDSWSRHCQEVSLDDRENLDSFKKLVSTIKKSRFCLEITIQIQISRSRSRHIEIYQKSW